jgi:Putative F0F1-ATPase subunit Ca2+/Mg2+ transporter
MNGLPPSARLVGIGFYIGTCIVVGTLGGREIDKLLDTGKLFTLVGLFTGLALALYGAFQQLMEVLDAIDKRRKAGK